MPPFRSTVVLVRLTATALLVLLSGALGGCIISDEQACMNRGYAQGSTANLQCQQLEQAKLANALTSIQMTTGAYNAQQQLYATERAAAAQRAPVICHAAGVGTVSCQ